MSIKCSRFDQGLSRARVYREIIIIINIAVLMALAPTIAYSSRPLLFAWKLMSHSGQLVPHKLNAFIIKSYPFLATINKIITFMSVRVWRYEYAKEDVFICMH